MPSEIDTFLLVEYYKSGSTPETITSNKVLASGFKLHANWEITLDLKVQGPANAWSKILTVRKKGFPKGKYGCRVPTLVIDPHGQLEVSASFSGKWNWAWYSAKLDKTWFSLKLRHYEGNFQIYIDNVLKHQYVNTQPQEWDDMELVLGNHHTVTNGEYRNLLFQGFSPGKFFGKLMRMERNYKLKVSY